MRAEYDRATGTPGQAATGAGGQGQATEVAPGIFVQPTAVDFGLLHPGRPKAYARVTVAWTGAAPVRVSSGGQGTWWTRVSHERPASGCVVFTLCARLRTGLPEGPRDGQFTVTLDDTSVGAHLTADFRDTAPDRPAPASPPEGEGGEAATSTRAWPACPPAVTGPGRGAVAPPASWRQPAAATGMSRRSSRWSGSSITTTDSCSAGSVRATTAIIVSVWLRLTGRCGVPGGM